MRILRWLQAYLALPAVLASVVGHTGDMIDKQRLVLDSATLPMGAAMLFCQDVTYHWTLAESSVSPLLMCCVRLSYADNFGVVALGANCTNIHLAVKKANL